MNFARIVSCFALVLTLVPALLFAAGLISDGAMKAALLVGTVLWFVAAPRWIRPEEE